MLRALALAALLVGCGEGVELDALELAAVAQPVTAETLGFAVAGEGAAELAGAVLARWERATCLDLRVTADGPHKVMLTEQGFSARTRAGQTTGTWEAAEIRVRPSLTEWQRSVVLTHELGHLLMLSNDHQPRSVVSEADGFAPENQSISSTLLARICRVRDCGCFAPES